MREIRFSCSAQTLSHETLSLKYSLRADLNSAIECVKDHAQRYAWVTYELARGRQTKPYKILQIGVNVLNEHKKTLEQRYLIENVSRTINEKPRRVSFEFRTESTMGKACRFCLGDGSRSRQCNIMGKLKTEIKTMKCK